MKIMLPLEGQGGTMKFGLSLPNRGPFGDIHLIVDLAIQAEEADWDGFFIWDHIASGVSPHIDP